MTSIDYQHAAQVRLSRQGGRITPVRIDVLGLLLASSHAVTHQEIEQAAKEQDLNFDRVTLYRTLDWLVDHGMAHKISGADRIWRYSALLNSSSSQHAHFHCKDCEQVFCMETIQPALLLSLPDGYKIDEVELNLQGHCPDCRNKTADKSSD